MANTRPTIFPTSIQPSTISMSAPEPAAAAQEKEIAPGVTEEDIWPYIYDKAYPFVFCSLCKTAILVSSGRSHIRGQHFEAITEMQRNRAAYTLCQLPGMFQTEAELAKYTIPVSVRKAIPYLEAPTAKLKCSRCSHACGNARNMQLHYCGQSTP